MKTLKEDWNEFKSWSSEHADIDSLHINMGFTLTEVGDGYMIKFDTPFGGYSELISDYKNLYDTLGHIFAEEDGIIDNMLNK